VTFPAYVGPHIRHLPYLQYYSNSYALAQKKQYKLWPVISQKVRNP